MIIEGIVVYGRQLGRTLGFPTANIAPERIEGSGPDGVYAAWFDCEGVRRACMLNIGTHPTLPGGGKSVEAHVFDFSGKLYGLSARVETVAYLRGEQKFASPEALREQLALDAGRAREILSAKQD